MKGNIKRLAVFMIIAAIAMFMAVTTASAKSPIPPAMFGQYAFTGTGNCLISPTGFTDYVPNDPAQAFLSPITYEGDYKFERDGSGTIQYTARYVDWPQAVIKIGNVGFNFKYNATDMHRFSVYFEPGTYLQLDWVAGPDSPSTMYFDVQGSCDGVVSKNKDTINITCGHPIIMLTLYAPPCGDPSKSPCPLTPVQAFCSWSHVGTRVDK